MNQDPHPIDEDPCKLVSVDLWMIFKIFTKIVNKLIVNKLKWHGLPWWM